MIEQEGFDEALKKVVIVHVNALNAFDVIEKSLQQTLNIYCSWAPVLFVLSYLESCWIFIMDGGCSGFHWVVSIINLFAVLFWYYKIWSYKSAIKYIRMRKGLLIKNHEKFITCTLLT